MYMFQKKCHLHFTDHPQPQPLPERPSSLHPVQASSEIPELARPVRDQQTGGDSKFQGGDSVDG